MAMTRFLLVNFLVGVCCVHDNDTMMVIGKSLYSVAKLYWCLRPDKQLTVIIMQGLLCL